MLNRVSVDSLRKVSHFGNPIRPQSQGITSISLGPLATGSEASHVSQCLEWLIKAFGPYGFSFSTKTRNGAAREKFPAIPTDKKWCGPGTAKASGVADRKDKVEETSAEFWQLIDYQMTQ